MASVPRVPLASLTRVEFERRFQGPNLPVLITGVTESWRAAREWVDEQGRPDVARLAALFDAGEVAIHDRRGKRRHMKLSEYADWWHSRQDDDNAADWLYLKDWHMAQQFPEYDAYTTPACLGEDWLNEHWAAGGTGAATAGDHRFVYIGPQGSTTGLHADILFSYSWSVNIVGRKLWRLVPAEQRALVSDPGTRPRAKSLSTLQALPSADGLAVIKVEQGAGELLFVPSGWYHEVENLEDTISVNHNWLTAHNIHWGLCRLTETLSDARAGLCDDAQDAELCEAILIGRCGLGLFGYAELLEGVLCRRMEPPLPRGEERDVSAAGRGQKTDEDRLACDSAAAALCDTLDWLEHEFGAALEPGRQLAIERQRELLRRSAAAGRSIVSRKRLRSDDG